MTSVMRVTGWAMLDNQHGADAQDQQHQDAEAREDREDAPAFDPVQMGAGPRGREAMHADQRDACEGDGAQDGRSRGATASLFRISRLSNSRISRTAPCRETMMATELRAVCLIEAERTYQVGDTLRRPERR